VSSRRATGIQAYTGMKMIFFSWQIVFTQSMELWRDSDSDSNLQLGLMEMLFMPSTRQQLDSFLR
jgi:hypothetical protein